MRLGFFGDPFTWYISQPAKCGPLTSHFSRLPSDDKINAPLRVPTNTRTLLMFHPPTSLMKTRETVCPSRLQNASENVLAWRYGEEAPAQAPVGLPAECFRGDAGRPMVAADHPGHDVAWLPHLQRIPRLLRRNCDEYSS